MPHGGVGELDEVDSCGARLGAKPHRRSPGSPCGRAVFAAAAILEQSGNIVRHRPGPERHGQPADRPGPALSDGPGLDPIEGVCKARAIL